MYFHRPNLEAFCKNHNILERALAIVNRLICHLKKPRGEEGTSVTEARIQTPIRASKRKVIPSPILAVKTRKVSSPCSQDEMNTPNIQSSCKKHNLLEIALKIANKLTFHLKNPGEEKGTSVTESRVQTPRASKRKAIPSSNLVVKTRKVSSPCSQGVQMIRILKEEVPISDVEAPYFFLPITKGTTISLYVSPSVIAATIDSRESWENPNNELGLYILRDTRQKYRIYRRRFFMMYMGSISLGISFFEYMDSMMMMGEHLPLSVSVLGRLAYHFRTAMDGSITLFIAGFEQGVPRVLRLDLRHNNLLHDLERHLQRVVFSNRRLSTGGGELFASNFLYYFLGDDRNHTPFMVSHAMMGAMTSAAMKDPITGGYITQIQLTRWGDCNVTRMSSLDGLISWYNHLHMEQVLFLFMLTMRN